MLFTLPYIFLIDLNCFAQACLKLLSVHQSTKSDNHDYVISQGFLKVFKELKNSSKSQKPCSFPFHDVMCFFVGSGTIFKNREALNAYSNFDDIDVTKLVNLIERYEFL